MKKFLRIIVIIAACCVGFVLGAFLWAVGVNSGVINNGISETDGVLPVCSITAALYGTFGYHISRLIK